MLLAGGLCGMRSAGVNKLSRRYCLFLDNDLNSIRLHITISPNNVTKIGTWLCDKIVLENNSTDCH